MATASGSTRRAFGALVACGALILGGCGGGGGGGRPSPVQDLTPPGVVSVVPVGGAVDVPVSQAISVTFSEPMDATTINAATYTLSDTSSNPVTGTVMYAGTTATFTPGGSLAYGSSYTATVTTGARDRAGNALANSYAWTFSTVPAPDTTAPAVIGTSPLADAARVALNASISATFSEAMDPATLTASTFTVKDGANVPVSGTVGYAGATATFTPGAGLAYATTYTATVTTGARDLAGNALSANHTWTFSTLPSATLTVSKAGTGTGSVGSAPAGIDCGAQCSHSYPDGDTLTLTATADSGSVFEGFSGGCSGVEAACSVTLDGDRNVTAIFDALVESAAGTQLGLDGANDVVVHQTGINPPGTPLDLVNFTIEAWIYPLAEKGMIVAADSGWYLMVRAQPLRLEFAVLTSTGFPVFVSLEGSSHPLQLNQWNHVVGIASTYGHALQVAVNGELSDPVSVPYSFDVGFPQTFSIGNSYPAVLGDYPFVGRIDEVHLSSSVARYPEDFTPSSLLDADGGTVGLWHFDEAAGATTFADSSGNGNALTGLNGAAAFAGMRTVQNGADSLFYARTRLQLVATAGPVAIADFNNDGNGDLASAGVFAITSENVTVFLGTGTGAFGPAAQFPTGASGAHPAVRVADFNNDGNQDLVVSNMNSLSILLGDGVGSFGAPALLAAGASPWSVAVGDFNGDGNADLAVANYGGNTVSILLGDGAGSFGSPADHTVGTHPAVATGDFDGDGDLDLAVTNADANTVSILLGTGTGTFGAPTDFAAGAGPGAPVVGDFNGDGKPDLAVVDGNSASVSVLMGTGAGAFAATVNYPVPFGGPASLATGDLDGDGALDLAVGCGGGTAAFVVLRGNGSGSFGLPIRYATESNPLSVAIGDLTGDGKPALAVGVAFNTIDILIAR